MSTQPAVTIRLAKFDDADSLARLKKDIWPEEESDALKITAALRHPSHCTFLAQVNEKIIGFVDGFITHSAAGILRWEVDLLGVASIWRGNGLGTQLVHTSLQAGKKLGAEQARALIQVNNVASQITFRRIGFAAQPIVYHLYTTYEQTAPVDLPARANLVPVVTFSYRGVWLEDDFSSSALLAARAALNDPANELAGALIPKSQSEKLRLAEAHGFHFVGVYQWWQIELKTFSSDRKQ